MLTGDLRRILATINPALNSSRGSFQLQFELAARKSHLQRYSGTEAQNGSFWNSITKNPNIVRDSTKESVEL